MLGLQRVKGRRLCTRCRLSTVLRKLHVYIYTCWYRCMSARKTEKEQKAFERCYLETKPSSQHCLGQTKQINRQPLLLPASTILSLLFPTLLPVHPLLSFRTPETRGRQTPFGYLLKRALPPLIHRVQLPTPLLHACLPSEHPEERDQDFHGSLSLNRCHGPCGLHVAC